MERLRIILATLGIAVGLTLSLAIPAQAAYSGSFTRAEYDQVYDGCGDARGCLTKGNVENGICNCTGVLASSQDVWGNGDPRRIFEYLLGSHVSTANNYGVYIYYRQRNPPTGNWTVEDKEWCNPVCNLDANP